VYTVKEFHRANPNISCDLLSVDGSHVYSDAVLDVSNMRTMANRNWNSLLIDDTNCGRSWCVDKVVDEHLRRGTVRDGGKRVSLLKRWRGFTLLHYDFQNVSAS